LLTGWLGGALEPVNVICKHSQRREDTLQENRDIDQGRWFFVLKMALHDKKMGLPRITKKWIAKEGLNTPMTTTLFSFVYIAEINNTHIHTFTHSYHISLSITWMCLLYHMYLIVLPPDHSWEQKGGEESSASLLQSSPKNFGSLVTTSSKRNIEHQMFNSTPSHFLHKFNILRNHDGSLDFWRECNGAD